MSSTTARALSGYRRLFRARKVLFQGDGRAMRESRVAIREQFAQNRAASDPAHIEGLLTMIDEAEDMLLHGIARGELNPATGNYQVKIRPEHTSDGDTPAHETTSMEPITKETGTKIGSKPEVVVTSSKGSEEGANR
uniref:Complex 1 LYR protein domain-containing protein n=1 Tax=Odontella aurita TaxID=265563 RepID=A0A7S4N614_9STRA